jgi:hypothetical protein
VARKKTLQTNFSAGELAPELGMRQDTDQYRNGAKSLRNMRCLIGGGVTRRPGMPYLAELTQPAVAIEFTFNQATQYILCFSTGRMDAFLPNGTAAGNLTSAPWTGNIPFEMDFEQSGNTIFLFHPNMRTQVVTRTGAATWVRADLTFFTGVGGRVEQPYYKIAAAAVTLAPSALTGTITLQLTAATQHFVAGHVGSRFRYLGREITITAVTDGDTATGFVIEPLPPTQTLTVTSSASFAVGEVILGDTSAARGLVTGIPDATHITAVIIQGLTPFEAEDLIGPNAVTAISAVANATPAAVVDWDEQLFSAVNGYPACGVLHRNRLGLAGHPQLPNAMMFSRLGNLYSHDLGDGSDADAIFETIGDAGASAIVQMHSAEQLLIATDHGLYYCPESQANPFRPTSIAFFPFGSPWPITATAKARSFDGGVMFLSGSLVVLVRPTGNLTQSWDAEEVSLLSSHIIDNPPRFGVTTNFNGGPERYALLVNDDGTVAATQIVAAQKIRNVTPWETTGMIDSIACLQGTAFATTTRIVRSATRFFLEVFDQDVTLDSARVTSNLADVPTLFGLTTVNVVTGNYSLGTYPLTVEDPPAGPYTVGLFYDTRVEPLPPALEDDEGPVAGDYMRILETYVHVLTSSRFAQNGYELAAYQVTEDPTAAPPLRTGPQRPCSASAQRWPSDVGHGNPRSARDRRLSDQRRLIAVRRVCIRGCAPRAAGWAREAEAGATHGRARAGRGAGV